MAANDNDPLNLTVRSLLELLVAQKQPDAEWVNVRSDEWPWRHIVAAAERGECAVSRVGRKLLMRREELDRWLALHAISARKPGDRSGDSSTSGGDSDDDNPVSHLLEETGFRRR